MGGPIQPRRHHPGEPCGVISIDETVANARQRLKQSAGGLLLVVDGRKLVALLDAADVNPPAGAPRMLAQLRKKLAPLVHVTIPEFSLEPSAPPPRTGLGSLLNPSFLAELTLLLVRLNAPGALVWQGGRLLGVLPRDTVTRVVPDDTLRQVLPRTAVGELPGHPRPPAPTYTCKDCGGKAFPAGQGAPAKCPSCGGLVQQDP
jgi:hypothetical protein